MNDVPESYPVSIEIEPPFLSRFQCGNTGIDYLHRIDSGKPGPHAMITSVVHGNEFSGAVAVAELLENPPPILRGRLSLCFVNAEACLRFDRKRPWHSRFIDEDLNRLWDDDVLTGPRQSLELDRARNLRPTIDEVDYLLDLHTMASVSPPLILAGTTERARDLAEKLCLGLTIVMDSGHQTGRRLRDYGAFSEENSHQTALLVECGQHWRADSVRLAGRTMSRFLATLGMTDSNVRDDTSLRSNVLRITHTITAEGSAFEFCDRYESLQTIERNGTVIAKDGDVVVTTPYDNCVLVMPTHGAQPGQTAVRLGRMLK